MKSAVPTLLPLLLLFLGTSLALNSERSPESDIELNFGARLGSSQRSKRQILIQGWNEYSKRWPDGVVHYYFSEDLDHRVEKAINRAMEKISSNTCINFTTEPADIMVRVYSDDTDRCQAGIGRVQDDQPFLFDYICNSAGMGVHELIHVLGFVHSHQRTDRDKYLEVDMEAVQGTQWEGQLVIPPRQKLIVPYDYGSVMQYQGDEFIPRKRGYRKTLGSEVVAYYDYYMINKFYNCFCGDRADVSCENHGYPNPRNCSQCICPYGYTGDDCSQAPGPILEAKSDWISVNVTLDAGPEDVRQLDYIYKFLWIQAPENKTIEVQVNKISGVECDEGCRSGGFEVKTLEDPRMTSPRECCTADGGGRTVFKSTNNPTVVMMFNAEGLDEYDLSYRFLDS